MAEDRLQIIPRCQRLDLSPAQKCLWFISQLETNIPAFNPVHAVRIRGRLNIPVLAKSITKIVDRHESLRMVFSQDEGKPYIRTIDPFGVDVRVFSFKDSPKIIAEQQVALLIRETAPGRSI